MPITKEQRRDQNKIRRAQKAKRNGRGGGVVRQEGFSLQAAQKDQRKHANAVQAKQERLEQIERHIINWLKAARTNGATCLLTKEMGSVEFEACIALKCRIETTGLGVTFEMQRTEVGYILAIKRGKQD